LEAILVVTDEMEQEKNRILIIDDEENILQVLRKALEREGYEIDTLLDAQEGLSILASSDYDLILCDMEMPRLSGIEYYLEIEERLPEMTDRFLFMTGEIQSPSIQKFLQDNRVSIISKPFDLSTLYQGVHDALQRSSGKKHHDPQD
jgi:two-component system NtrC family sensor kinase